MGEIDVTRLSPRMAWYYDGAINVLISVDSSFLSIASTYYTFVEARRSKTSPRTHQSAAANDLLLWAAIPPLRYYHPVR